MGNSKLSLVYYPSPKLRAPTREAEVDPSIEGFVRDMAILMLDNGGIGLAAPQVGRDERIVVLNLSQRPGDTVALLNPVVTDKSDDTWFAIEGCLSFPGVKVRVERPVEIKVSALDINGDACDLELKEGPARCLLHEIDHLNGKLLIDYCGKIKRDSVERKMAKRARLARRQALQR